MDRRFQQLLGELFGTFILVFLGAATVIGFGDRGVWAPFGFGIGLLAALYAFGEMCGGHFNPIVSLALFLDRRLAARETIERWIAQFAGAVLAALALLLRSSSDDVARAATVPGGFGVRGAFFAEVFCSAIFMMVILHVTTSKIFGSTTYVAIALSLLAIHFAIIPFSGSSVNPARSFGTALIGNKWTDFWIYIIAPPLGAIIGWLIYTVVVKGNTNLGDDLRAMRTDIAGARGGSGSSGGTGSSGGGDTAS
jgi:aquaporin Z